MMKQEETEHKDRRREETGIREREREGSEEREFKRERGIIRERERETEREREVGRVEGQGKKGSTSSGGCLLKQSECLGGWWKGKERKCSAALARHASPGSR
jgi:hypothetical protein